MLTRKLAYSIYCFLLSLIEFILKKKKYFLKQEKNQSWFALKFFCKFLHFWQGKKDICSPKIYTSWWYCYKEMGNNCRMKLTLVKWHDFFLLEGYLFLDPLLFWWLNSHSALLQGKEMSPSPLPPYSSSPPYTLSSSFCCRLLLKLAPTFLEQVHLPLSVA